jgi:CheY-like chemotaxis protein
MDEPWDGALRWWLNVNLNRMKSSPAMMAKHRVLVVDDDKAIRHSLKKVLEGGGYEVVLAADGLEAAARFVPGQFDLLLLDLNLPSQSGWEVFERLTTMYPFVPVIIITGMPNQYKTALAAGAGALLEKPVDVPALLNTMEKLLMESKDTPLRRMSGELNDTGYVGAAKSNGLRGQDPHATVPS